MALLNVDQVSALLEVPKSSAYRIIRELNAELKEMEIRTLRGRIEERYLKERYGLGENAICRKSEN